ncbi:MAG: hypothetical protein MUF31_18340 [Akkermansiaceae bacterium]|jgi:hypothetical protein|nr:hypothetical protein [Akkermansiaceae bacterium]
MKTTIQSISIAFLSLLSVVSAFSPKVEAAPPPDGESLYLHCFRPTYGQKVILDPSENKDATPATPASALLTLKIRLGSEFYVSVGERGYWLAGKTFSDGGRLMASFEGMFGSSSHVFNGPIELEKVFDPKVSAFFSAVMPFRCVFSRHKDVKPFLDAQTVLDEKRLAEATESTRKNIEIQKMKAEPDAP